VESASLNELGLVMDFRLLKNKTRAVLQALDHSYLNELPSFKGKNPSSENLASYIFQELAREMDQEGYRLSRVSVWESETSRATYRREEK